MEDLSGTGGSRGNDLEVKHVAILDWGNVEVNVGACQDTEQGT
jgi:hypothetical protein